MRSLARSLADGMLAGFNSSPPTGTTHQCKEGKRSSKEVWPALQKRGCKINAISFLFSNCSTFSAAWVCSQSYASISHIHLSETSNLMLYTCKSS